MRCGAGALRLDLNLASAFTVFTAGKLLSTPPPWALGGFMYGEASVKYLIQCPEPGTPWYPTEDTLELPKTLPLSFHFLAQGHSVAPY